MRSDDYATEEPDRGYNRRSGEVQRKPLTAGVDERNSLLSFFIPDLTVGGAEQVTINIVNGLSARGYNVELVLSRSEGKLRSQLERHVSVVELPPSHRSGFGVVANLPWLVSYLHQKKPVALFPHLCHVNVVCLAVNRAFDTDTMVIPTHHSALTRTRVQSPKDRVVYWLVPRLYPTADRIIAVSEGVADSIVEQTSVKRDDISVLYNPIDVESVRIQSRKHVDHEWITDENIDVILFVGRISEEKDLKTWLRAFKDVHRRNPATRALIVGQGPQRADIEAFVNELGLGGVVSMLGYFENPYRYMSRADVFLLSSKFEGLPTTLIEALACGCPIVATDCESGPREILADGEYGPLVPVGNAAELADAVIETLDDPISADELRARADDFAPDSIFDDYERFIDRYIH